ncbi:MAG: HD domain-containing protein [Deltaproteobacteria bacterium]|nr:HD domain-containing protein [Deltaproteobacteria bacterium]
MSPSLSPRFADAAAWAATLHAGQLRKGTTVPYISHPLAVASIVLEHGGDEDQAIAALLHDGPEDCGGQEVLDEVGRRFGERTMRLVGSLSDTLEEEKPAWRPRKESYLAHLREEVGDDVLLVSMADKLHNAGSILRDLRAHGPAIFDRFTGQRSGTLWYYGALVEAYRSRPAAPTALLAALERTVAAIQQEAHSPESRR